MIAKSRRHASRPALGWVAAIAVLVLVTACTGATNGDVPVVTDELDSEEVTEDEAANGEPEIASITVGVLPLASLAPLHLAIQEGYFAEEGLQVTPQDIGAGGAAAIPALMAGELDITYGNYVSAYFAAARGLDLRVIAEATRATPDFNSVMVLDDDIQEAADLEGRTVAVNTLQNIGELAINEVVDHEGGDAAQLQYTEINFPDMGVALERGDIDAIWVPEPWVTIYEGQIGARKMLDPFSGPTDGLPIVGYFASQEYIDRNPNTVQAFQRGLARGVELAQRDSGRVEEIVPTFTAVSAEMVTRITNPEFVSDPDPTELQRTADLMYERGWIEQPLDLASITWWGAANELDR